MKKRVLALDYLRGFMAFSVLIYHYTSWLGMDLIYPFDNLINRLGIFAVSAFYVLSGTSLAIGYAKKEVSPSFLKKFAIKRFFRIAPLLYFVTTVSLILILLGAYINNDYTSMPSIYKVILNYSMLFGWLSPTSYIATGAWSIGNELVFYSIFPIMLYLINKSKSHFISFFLLSILVSGYFSEFLLTTEKSLADQWGIYINPLNLLYFFTGGVLIGLLLKSGYTLNKKLALPSLVVASGILIFMPVSGHDQIVLVTGYSKLIFSLVIFLLAIVSALSAHTKENKITKVFKYLGETSYSLYLLHPVVFSICSIFFSIFPITDNQIVILLVSIVGTLIASYVSYKFIEKPFMGLGNKVTTQSIKHEVTSIN